MENKVEKLKESPPFFKKWSGLYLFLLFFELLLILIFIWMTNSFHA
tara:strand:- start:167 stop:304 length:138 start_codon:yes stop_codon:yes gene_type:complete